MENVSRCDMHAHSSFSKELIFSWDESSPPRLWYEKMSYSLYKMIMKLSRRVPKKKGAIYFLPAFNPKQLYDFAMKRGMDFFAITDHDSLDAYYWFIKNYPKLKDKMIPGVELTSRIPGKGFHLHICIFGLNQKQLVELKKLSSDVKKVVSYCKKNKLVCSLNHISNSFVQQLSTNQGNEIMLEKDSRYLMNLFDFVEIRNGLTEERDNEKARILAEKYHKLGLGGSDSHIGFIGTTWTEVPRVKNKEQFLSMLLKGKGVVCGNHGGKAIIKKELVYQAYNYSGMYYTDYEKIFEHRLDFWSRGYLRGLIFCGIEKVVQLLIHASAPFVSRWAHNRLE